MPVYDVACPDCGVNEVTSEPSIARADGLTCGLCAKPAPQSFSPEYFFGARIDAGGENVTDAARVKDGSSGWNAGLPGVETQVGVRADGKKKTTYRPITHAELGSNAGVREYAKTKGLTAIDGGRFRTTPR